MKYIFISTAVLLLGLVGFLNPMRDLFLRLFVPVQFGLNKMGRNVGDTFGFFANVTKVRQENMELLSKIMHLEEETARLLSLQEENDLLKSQIEFSKVSGIKVPLILVEIMGNPNDITDTTFLINAGSKDNIRTGDIAVVGPNVVGTVKSVGYSRAEVELITSPNLSFTAFDVNSVNKTQGLAVGKHNSILSLERILPTDDIKEGDIIMTSGREGTFLPNYIVGKVIQVHTDPSQPLKRASIKTAVDFFKLTKVYILRKETADL
jgi:rod shape-determining protein MreC